MWKIITLSIFLIFVEATNIQDLYGEWVPTSAYPVTELRYARCTRTSFVKIPEDVSCSCDDGRNTTLVIYIEIISASSASRNKSMPILVVETPAEVAPALNISCKCGDEEFTTRAVARLVNDNYFILYQTLKSYMLQYRTVKDQNYAQLFTKTIQPYMKLTTDIEGIEELRGRERDLLCCSESYELQKVIEARRGQPMGTEEVSY